MEYVQLGRAGVRVSRLCLGSMNFGGRTDEETAIAIINEALEAGINFIDTANVYGRGVSEQIVGKALAENGRRDEVVLATKAVAAMGDGQNDHGASRYHLMRACEDSLRRLRTDRIDLYYLHVVDLTTPMDEILDTLDTLVKQGKILYVGTSKWPPTLIMEGLALADAHGLPRFVAEQPPYQMLDRGIENELVWMCMRQGIAICSWGPLAYGLLSGRYRKGEPPYEGGRFANAKPGDVHTDGGGARCAPGRVRPCLAAQPTGSYLGDYRSGQPRPPSLDDQVNRAGVDRGGVGEGGRNRAAGPVCQQLL